MRLERTEVSAERSADDICVELVSVGARRISRDYDEKGVMTGMMWTIKLEGNDVTFKMPARINGVLKHLKENSRSHKDINIKARNVAWRQLLYWVRAQVVMIQTDMVEPTQPFMAYAWNEGTQQTLFDSFRNQQKQLAAGKG